MGGEKIGLDIANWGWVGGHTGTDINSIANKLQDCRSSTTLPASVSSLENEIVILSRRV